MAEAVAEGLRAAGAETELLTPEQVHTDGLAALDAVALGCPAMGSEVLEETEFQPCSTAARRFSPESPRRSFGSYGWGDGEWMREWENDCRAAGIPLCLRALFAARRRTTRHWTSAARSDALWRNKRCCHALCMDAAPEKASHACCDRRHSAAGHDRPELRIWLSVLRSQRQLTHRMMIDPIPFLSCSPYARARAVWPAPLCILESGAAHSAAGYSLQSSR